MANTYMARLKNHVVDNVINKVVKSPWAKIGAHGRP